MENPDEQLGPISPPTSSISRTKINKKYFILFIVAALIVGYFVPNIISHFTSPKSIRTGQYADSKLLHIVTMDPNTEVVEPKKITFTFNDDVDPHHFENFFQISPNVEGEFHQGFDKKKIEFVPKEPFRAATSFGVIVRSGFVSMNGKTLFDNFYGDFRIASNDTSVQYLSSGVTGRVLSFSANNKVNLTIDNKSTYRDVKVYVYPSDEEHLLTYLTYYSDQKTSYPQEKYISTSSVHSDKKSIMEFDVKGSTANKSLALSPGIYYLEAKGAPQISNGSVFIIVNKTGITARQDDQKIILAAFDLATGKKISDGVTATFYNLEKTPNIISSNLFNEVGNFGMPFSSRVDLIVGKRGDETMIIPFKLPQSLADIKVYSDLSKDTKVFLYTDRPIYKPGDTVFYKGIVRQDNDSLYTLPSSGTQVKIWINGSTSKNEVEQTISVDSDGTFSGNFIVPQSLVNSNKDYTDVTYMYAAVSPESSTTYSPSYAYFNVVEYKKPEFEIKVEAQKGEYTKNEKPTYIVTGKYFDGSPLANAEVDYATYATNYYEAEKAVYNSNFNFTQFGGMCGGGFGAWQEYYGDEVVKSTVTLDANGKATVSTDPSKKELLSKTYTLKAWKVDKNKNEVAGAANAIVHTADYNIFFPPSPTSYKSGDEIVVPFYAESLKGEKVTDKEFTYKLLKQVYTSSENREETVKSGTVKSDGNGNGLIALTLPKEQNITYYIVIETRDLLGNLAQGRKSVYTRNKDSSNQYDFFEDPSDTYLKIVSTKNSFKVGDTLKLTVKSPKELDALVSFERGRVYKPSYVHINEGETTLEVPIDADLSPSITAVFSFFADGSYHSEGLSLNVPAMHMLMNVAVKTDKTRYKPTETALVSITTHDAYDNPVVANLSMGIVDKAIYGLKKSATPPIHSSFYYFRPRRTNASSSLTWVGTYNYGGRGGGGGGGALGGPAVDTLYWNPNITTSSNGEANLSVDLKNYKTTWKVQVIGSTEKTQVGQADTEFIVAD